MSEFLVVRLAEEPAQASWLILSAEGHRLSRTMSGPLSDAVAESRNREVLLLVPGVDATTKRVTLPVKRPSRIQQMLPFSLEDVVAEDVESLLFAAGPRRDDGSIPVAIVARDLVGGWLNQCEAAGLSVDAVFVDVQGVPDTPGSLTLMLEGSKTYCRAPDREPFVLEDVSIDELVGVLASESHPSAYLNNVVVYADDDGYREREAQLQRLREQASSVDVTVLPDGVLPRMASTLVTEPGSNLLQGPFRLKSDWNEILRPWRMPAMLVLGLIVAATLVQVGRYVTLSRQDGALSELIGSSCQTAFATPSLSDCDAEIRRRLAAVGAASGTGSRSGFLDTLVSVADARDARMVIQALSFREGVMNLRIIAPDVQSLDSLAQALGSGGRLQANIQSTAPADNGVEGRIQIAEVKQ